MNMKRQEQPDQQPALPLEAQEALLKELARRTEAAQKAPEQYRQHGRMALPGVRDTIEVAYQVPDPTRPGHMMPKRAQATVGQLRAIEAARERAAQAAALQPQTPVQGPTTRPAPRALPTPPQPFQQQHTQTQTGPQVRPAPPASYGNPHQTGGAVAPNTFMYPNLSVPAPEVPVVEGFGPQGSTDITPAPQAPASWRTDPRQRSQEVVEETTTILSGGVIGAALEHGPEDRQFIPDELRQEDVQRLVAAQEAARRATEQQPPEQQ